MAMVTMVFRSERGGRWGWHQLDRRWARRLVDEAGIRRGDLVVDVGAGAGVITRELVARGARVVAVELHPRRAELLKSRFTGQAMTVVRADASALRLPGRPFKVVANPPFAITTSLLRHLTNPRSQLELAVVVLPTWAATRWASGRGVGGITSKRMFSVDICVRLPDAAFTPAPPRSTTAVIITRAPSPRRGR